MKSLPDNYTGQDLVDAGFSVAYVGKDVAVLLVPPDYHCVETVNLDVDGGSDRFDLLCRVGHEGVYQRFVEVPESWVPPPLGTHMPCF